MAFVYTHTVQKISINETTSLLIIILIFNLKCLRYIKLVHILNYIYTYHFKTLMLIKLTEFLIKKFRTKLSNTLVLEKVVVIQIIHSSYTFCLFGTSPPEIVAVK